jgi:hypothetical protein
VGPLGIIGGLAVALVVVVLAGIEVAARARGFKPSVKDSPALWSAYRQRARTPPGPDAPVVLTGSSRFMLGIDPRLLSTVVGRPVVNLAIDGSYPFAVVDDLANDDAFHGIVLCELGAFVADGSGEARAGRAKPDEYLRYFHSRTAVSDTEALMREWLQSRLALLVPEFSLRKLAPNLAFGSPLPRPGYLRMLPGRTRLADYSLVDLDQHRRHWIEAYSDLGPPRTDAQLLAFVDRLAGWVRRIRARGGDVVFFRMVTSGGVRAQEDAQTPRAQWDLFASHVLGHAIHFEDVPSLRGFTAIDGSHLDGSVVGPFTRALGEALLASGAVPRGR